MLCPSRGDRARKTSRRDLAYVVARRLDGATTVSATMLLAHRAGIPVFVTGGAPPFLLPILGPCPACWDTAQTGSPVSRHC